MSDEEKIKKWWDRKDGGARDFFRARADSSDFKEQQKNMNFKNSHRDNYIGGESGILLGKKYSDLNPKERNEVKNAYKVSDDK